MPRYARLRKEARELIAQAREIEANAETEGRDLTEDELLKIDGLLDEAEKKSAQANKLERLANADAVLSAQARNPGVQVTTADGDGGGDGDAIVPRIEPGADGLIHSQDGDGVAVRGTGSQAQVPDALRGANRVHAQARDGAEEGRCGFGFFGEFALAVVAACQRGGAVDERLLPLQHHAAATGGSQGVGSTGGFLVPPTFGTTIWDGMSQDMLALLPRTDNFTVIGDSVTFPANAETSRTGGVLFGGAEANWVAEAEQIPATRPKFRQVKLEPQELAVLIYQTDKLLRNSAVALEQYLNRVATECIMFKVNEAIYRGDGVGKPLGLLNSGALITVAKEAAQAADTFVYANVVKMFSRLHAARRANAVWLINQDVEPQLYSIVDPSNNVPMFIPPGRLSDAPFGTLMGRPILPLEHCSTLGDLGDIMLVDLSAYATGTRAGGGIMSAQSPHLRFDFSETAFRFIMEVDGQSWLADPITPPQSALTLSPYVTLATRA